MPVLCENCLLEYDEVSENCPYCGYARGGMAAEPTYLNPGTLLKERYAVGQVVGASGFGIIYRAWDNEDNRIVAVKEYYRIGLVSRIPGSQHIRPVSDSNAEEFLTGKQLFITEETIIKSIPRHPNIATILDVIECNGTIYHVMELPYGETLDLYNEPAGRLYSEVFPKEGVFGPPPESRMTLLSGAESNREGNEKKALSLQDRISIILKIGDALRMLHLSGILHCGVSPDSIYIPYNRPGQDAKLFGFEMACFSSYEQDPQQVSTIISKDNNKKQAIIKPGYSPPELYAPGSEQNRQTDIYGLGATLYYLLTDIKPEEATDRKNEDIMPSPKALNSEVPDNISNAVLTAMATDMHLRYKTIEEFQASLTSQKRILAPREKAVRLKKKRKIILFSSAVCLSAGIIIFSILLALEIGGAALSTGSIALLYPFSGDAAVDMAKLSSLTMIVGYFEDLYPNASVSIRGVAADDYAGEVEALLRRGDYPAVFETTTLDPATLSSALDVSGIIGRDQIKRCYFLGDYTRLFPDRRQIPVGFNASAFYINAQLCAFDKTGVDDISSLLASMPYAISERGFSCDDSYLDDLLSIFSGNYPICGRGSFIANETGALYSGTAEYYALMEEMAGRLRVLYIDSGSVHAEYSDLWSIMPGSRAEQETAKRFLQYMLGETAQYYLHIYNNSRSFPINIRSLDTYCEVYIDFSDFFANISDYEFK